MSEWAWIWFLFALGVVAVGIAITVVVIVMLRNLSRRVELLERERATSSTLRSKADGPGARTAADEEAVVTGAHLVPDSPTDAPAAQASTLSAGSRQAARGSEAPRTASQQVAAFPGSIVPSSSTGGAIVPPAFATRAPEDASREATIQPPPSTAPAPRSEWASPIDESKSTRPLPAAESFADVSTADPRSAGSPPRSPSNASAERFEWERWLGVRGAAVGGGIVLAIAGFLFLQYSIERQWITPERRTILAAIAGFALFVASIPLRRRGYRIVADSITGTGAVLLYASSWAAHVSYGMIGFPAAFGAMVGVTAACAYLAQRHESLVIAVLGLVGGFATPLALSSGHDRPIALFGYVLLLDFAFLFIAQKRRWPSLTLVALGGTFVIQALWVFLRVDRNSLPLALIVLAVFALFFAVFVARQAAAERARLAAAQFGALVLPFVFAIYFAQDRALGEHVWPLLALASVLAVASAWMARTGDLTWLPFGSAAGAVALTMTWTVNRVFAIDRDATLELIGCAIGVTLLHVALAELASRSANKPRGEGARGAVVVATIGFQLVVLFAASRPIDVGPWPWIVATTVFALVIHRQVGIGERSILAFAASAIVGITIFTWSTKHDSAQYLPGFWLWGGALVLVGSTFLFAAWLLRARESHWPYRGVLAFALPTMLALLALGSIFDSTAIYVAVAVVGVQGAIAATACRSSVLFGLAITLPILHPMTGGGDPTHLANRPGFMPTFACIASFGVLFAVWPLLRSERWNDRAAAWRIAAGSLVVQFFVLYPLFVARSFDVPVFSLPIAFEVVAGAAAMRLYATRAGEDRARRIGRIWYSCAAIFFAALIVPLQLEREAIPIALALFAAGIALFHVRIDARSLAWVAFAALLISFFALVVIGLLGEWPHSSTRILNWVAYTHLLPGAAAIVTAVFLRRAGAQVAASSSGILAILFVFAWINLEVANAFTNVERFTLRFEHTPMRDLTASLAWLAYAIVLLVLGVSKQRGGLRWASLVLLLLTIAKVFIFDLAHLEGLHRAASVAGLGLSLLLVSVLYQRFVFRRPASTT